MGVPPSREHASPEPDSSDENSKIAAVLLVGSDGPVEIVVCGAV